MKKLILLLSLMLFGIANGQQFVQPTGTNTSPQDTVLVTLTNSDTVYVWYLINDLYRYANDTLQITDSDGSTMPTTMRNIVLNRLNGSFNWNGNLYTYMTIDSANGGSDSLAILRQPCDRDGNVILNDIRYGDFGSDATFESSIVWLTSWTTGGTYGASSGGQTVPMPCFRDMIIQRASSLTNTIKYRQSKN